MINDTTCGCDSSQGYIFVIKPEHNCYCMPSKEDCSCHKLSCNDKDILCPFIGSAVRNVSCPKILIRPSTQKNESSTSVEIFNDVRSSYYEGRKYRLTCFYFSTSLVIVMITVLAVNDTTTTDISASYLDFLLEMTTDGLSEWPDVLYIVRTKQFLVDQDVSGNSSAGDSIEIERLQKEKNRTVMEKLLSGDENDYNEFITFLKEHTEYVDLVYGIENTFVTDDDRIAFLNCQRNTEKRR